MRSRESISFLINVGNYQVKEKRERAQTRTEKLKKIWKP
jgi:hypothetical protein